MTFLDAAFEVLTRAGRPMTAGEIAEEALRLGLLSTAGKTPAATMTAQLYLAVRDDPNCPIVRQFELGNARARRGSVRWVLRTDQREAPERSEGVVGQ